MKNILESSLIKHVLLAVLAAKWETACCTFIDKSHDKSSDESHDRSPDEPRDESPDESHEPERPTH